MTQNYRLIDRSRVFKVIYSCCVLVPQEHLAIPTFGAHDNQANSRDISRGRRIVRLKFVVSPHHNTCRDPVQNRQPASLHRGKVRLLHASHHKEYTPPVTSTYNR